MMKTKLAAFQKEVRELAAKHGFDVTKSRAKFTDSEFTLSLGCALKGVAPEKTVRGANLNYFGPLCGLPADLLGRTFKGGTLRNMKVVGFNTRAPKNKIELERVDGKRFKCSTVLVKLAIDSGY